MQIFVIQFPKFFTTNGDGVNATWIIKGTNKEFYQPNSSINIFNRFGKLMTQILIDSQGWNGTYNGKTMPSNDYWFVAKLSNGKEYRGHFALVR